jgi:hypothetical protein
VDITTLVSLSELNSSAYEEITGKTVIILSVISSGVPRNFVRGGWGQQIQLRTEKMGIWGQ